MARFIYIFLSYLLLPVLAAYLLWRSRKQPEYRRHWSERFALRLPSVAPGAIWIHAVSLGETLAAESLILALRQAFPDRELLLTHTTPTGRAAGLRLAERVPRLSVVYLPYDTPWAVKRFLLAVKPCVGLLMETEVWPNLIACANTLGIPMALINARLSEKSLQRGKKYSNLARDALGTLSLVLAQTREDARRLGEMGAQSPQTLGNLKFDIEPAPELLERGQAWKRYFARPHVLLLANTREGEELMFLSALKSTKVPLTDGASPPREPATSTEHWPQGLLVLLVPRHPQRFNDVEKMIRAEGFSYVRRSSDSGVDTLIGRLDPNIQIVLGDSLGEMAAYYGAADLAVMGGSFQKLGGHNLIEACACKCPVIVGPHMFNFELASEEAVRIGAAWSVSSASEAILRAFQLLTGEPHALQDARAACTDFSQRHRGATQRTLVALKALLR